MAILTTTLFVAFLIVTLQINELSSSNDQIISEFIRRGRYLSNDDTCSAKNVEKLFKCMDKDSNGKLTWLEIIERRKCYSKYDKYSLDFVQFFSCVSENKVEVTYQNAIDRACLCLDR